MKNSLLAIIIALSFLIISCDKSDDNVIIKIDKAQEKIFEKYGIKPSDSNQINNILGMIDVDGYKLAFGKKNNKAWYAKFNSTGDQIYTYELESDQSGEYAYSHCNMTSNKLISENKIFLQCYRTNDNRPESLSDIFHSVLVVIDFEKGLVISKLKSQKQSYEYRNISKEDGFYFIENAYWHVSGPVSSYHILNSDGSIMWERDIKVGEEKGIKTYDLNYFTDSSTIIYCVGLTFSDPNGYSARTFLLRSINLKEYKILSEKFIVVDGEHKDQSNISYSDLLISKEDGNIRITYKEKREITDQISGNTTYETLNEYFILLSGTDWNEIERGKVQNT